MKEGQDGKGLSLDKMAQMFTAAADTMKSRGLSPEEMAAYKARATKIVALLDHEDAAVRAGVEEIMTMIEEFRKDFIIEPEFYVRPMMDSAGSARMAVDEHMLAMHAGARDALGQAIMRIKECKKFLERVAKERLDQEGGEKGE